MSVKTRDGKPSVLIVDDESAILDTLRILLKNEGFEAHVAHGGRAGLEQIEATDPDIVLTDVRMPNVGGVRPGPAVTTARSAAIVRSTAAGSPGPLEMNSPSASPRSKMPSNSAGAMSCGTTRTVQPRSVRCRRMLRLAPQ